MGFLDFFQRILPPSFLNSRFTKWMGLYSAVARQFDDLQDAIIDGREQFFIDSATWALPIYEAEFAIKLVDKSNDAARRNNVMAMSRGGLGANPAPLTSVLQSYGYSTEILEDFGAYTVTIQFDDFRGIPPNIGDLQALMVRMIPGHLQVKWKYIYTQHEELKAFTYAQMKTMTNEQLKTQLPKG